MLNSIFGMMNSPILLAAAERSPGVIVGPIAKLMGIIFNWVFNFIYSFTETGSLVLGIIVFTLLVKLVLFPLSYKQVKGTYKMQKLQPELNKIKAKYANKTDEESQRRMAFEIQEFQRENGASMLAGCLPMIIQLPILYALFYIFQQPYNYVEVINNVYTSIANAILGIDVAQRVEVFKTIILSKNMTMDLAVFSDVFNLVKHMGSADWNTALSTLGTSGTELASLIAQKHSIEYFFGLNLVTTAGLGFPGILVPICAGLSTFLSSKYMMSKQQNATGTGDEADMAAGMTKSMNVVMPIMMGVITINTPVALGIYWTLSNLFSIFQTWTVYKVLGAKDENGELNLESKSDKKAKIADKNKKGAK